MLGTVCAFPGNPFPGTINDWLWLDKSCGEPSWTVRHGFSPHIGTKDFFKFMNPGIHGVPTIAFLVLITLFSILIGPVNYLYLSRKKMLWLLLFTVPALACGTERAAARLLGRRPWLCDQIADSQPDGARPAKPHSRDNGPPRALRRSQSFGRDAVFSRNGRLSGDPDDQRPGERLRRLVGNSEPDVGLAARPHADAILHRPKRRTAIARRAEEDCGQGRVLERASLGTGDGRRERRVGALLCGSVRRRRRDRRACRARRPTTWRTSWRCSIAMPPRCRPVLSSRPPARFAAAAPGWPT